MLNPLRRHFGLRWRNEYPSASNLGITASNLLAVAVILLLYGIAGSMDYADQQQQAAADQQNRAELNRAALLACLNGGAPGLYTESADGVRVYLVCDPPYEVSEKNIKKRTS